MHWDWATFAIGIGTGLMGGVALAGISFWAFARAMANADQ